MFPYSPIDLLRMIANDVLGRTEQAWACLWRHPKTEYVKECVAWFFLNEIDFKKLPQREAFRRSLDDAGYGLTRRDEIREYAEQLYEETKKGSQLANERVEKLLAIVLVATGWIATKDFYILSMIALLLSAAVLLFGRWKNVSSAPLDFQEFASTASKYKKGDEKDQREFDIDVACQYALAAWEINYRTGLVQRRLLLGIILLLLGLFLAACRW